MRNKELNDFTGYKKMVLVVDCGIGTRNHTAYLVPLEYPQNDLDTYAWECAVEHAESYGLYPEPDFSEYEDGDCDSEEYCDDIGGWFEDYNAKEHDGQLIFGNNRDFTWEYI